MIAELVALCPTFYFLHYLYKEQKDVKRAQRKIPIRIHVNGIRGKTTVTRLIGSIIRPIYPTLTKTTGSEPVIIFPDETEEKIIRKGQVKIEEQIKVLKIAEGKGAKCIVFECMAIDPIYQKILEEKVMKSTIGIITNIRYDHEDVMGESIKDIARSLCNTIPYNSHLIVPENIAEVNIVQSIADERKTIVHYARLDSVPKGYVQRFDFMNFDENVAIALEVANILGIEKDVALENMLKTTHDIGKGKVYTRILEDKRVHFINSFANNDAQSLVIMLSRVKFREKSKKIALVNHRKDRERRTWGFIHLLCNYGFDSILISSDNKLIEKELRSSGFKGDIVTTTGNYINILDKLSNNRDNYWIGIANIKSNFADSVLNYFGVS